MTPAQRDLIALHQSKAPVDVLALAKAMGLGVFTAALGKQVSGILRPGTSGPGGKYIILVNEEHNSNRKRFTIAHEIGHYVLHVDQIGKGITDDEFYRALPGPLERQANEFAANLLMPWPLINQAQDAGFTSLPALAKRLGVSKQAMAIRLGIPFDENWD